MTVSRVTRGGGLLGQGARARTRLEEALGRFHQRSEDALIRVELDLELEDPLAVLAASGDRGCFAWIAEHETVIGIGVARRVRGVGSDRVDQIRQQAEALARCFAPPAGEGREEADSTGRCSIRLFGGMAFQPGSAADPEWQPFGDADFVLPRWLLSTGTGGSRAVLTLEAAALHRTGLERTIDAALTELAALEAVGARAGARSVAPGGSNGHGLLDSAREHRRWHALIDDALAEIASGRAEKIVPARQFDSVLERPPGVDVLVRRFLGHPSNAVFAFQRGGGWFLGATPERLVALEGRRVVSHALAGSEAAPADDADAEALAAARGRLLARVKDRHEHEAVSRHLRDALRPLCATLELPAEPRVLCLDDVLHLETPIRGELSRPVDVLELVELLHPTPAVAGRPVDHALRWIAEHEPRRRGWYAGPVGWFDLEGNGDFRIAIRSALLTDGRAHLFAGAGVVAGSEAEAELEEIAVKLEPACRALGLASPTARRRFPEPERERELAHSRADLVG